MSVIKRIARSISAWVLAFSVFAIASFAAIALTVLNPTYIKTTLVKSGDYNTIVDATLKLATFGGQGNNTLSTQTIKEVTPIIKAAITPAFLQRTVETIIDGTFVWLRGGADYPNFVIKTADVKSSLTEGLNTYLYNRYEKLPICPRGTSYQSFDPLNATCKPPIQISATDISQTSADFVNSIPLFDTATISLQNFGTTEAFAKDKPAAKAPIVYAWAKRLPYIFTALAIASVIVLLILSDKKSKIWRTIGHTFTWAALMLLLTSALTYLFLQRFNNTGFIGSASLQQLEFANTIFTPVTNILSKSLANYSLYFSVFYAIIGAGCYWLSHHLTRNEQLESTNTIK